jgi:hypothetical protein
MEILKSIFKKENKEKPGNLWNIVENNNYRVSTQIQFILSFMIIKLLNF